jgi:hypothetical protein
MDSGRRNVARKSSLDALVGLQAGTLGGVAMLVWFALALPLTGEPWWLIANLWASRWYSVGTVLMEPGFVTLSGAAMLLFLAGITGVVNGLLTPGGRLFGLAVAIAWYLLCHAYLWKRIAPMMAGYASQPVLAAGFLVYGSAIGWHPQLLARARERIRR